MKEDIENVEFEEVQHGVFAPKEIGDSIAGVLVNKIPANEEKELNARYVLETKKGLITVWGSAILNDRMHYIELGTIVKIVYEGQDDLGKGKKLNKFKVMTGKKKEKPVDNTDTQEPDPVQAEDIPNAPKTETSEVATGADTKIE